MAILPQTLELHNHTDPSAITGNPGSDRVAGRKRSRDVDDDKNENEAGSEHPAYQDEHNLPGPSKKARVKDVLDASSLMSAFDAPVPSSIESAEVVKDDVPIQDNDTTSTPTAPHPEAVEFAELIAFLLNDVSQKTRELLLPLPKPYPLRRLPTSPLSDSPYRAPFVRKEVGGPCRGRVESPLTTLVLRNNHMNDILSSSPSSRSSEWIETFHEMGWEFLHPSWVSDSDDTYNVDDIFKDWIEVDVDAVASSSQHTVRSQDTLPESAYYTPDGADDAGAQLFMLFLDSASMQ